MMPRPTHIGIRDELFALACEGMGQGAIAGHMDLNRATVNHTLRKHAATGTLVLTSPWGLLRMPHLVNTMLCLR